MSGGLRAGQYRPAGYAASRHASPVPSLLAVRPSPAGTSAVAGRRAHRADAPVPAVAEAAHRSADTSRKNGRSRSFARSGLAATWASVGDHYSTWRMAKPAPTSIVTEVPVVRVWLATPSASRKSEEA